MAANLAEVTLGNLHLIGRSVAGEETFVALPEYNVAFDFGTGPRELISIDHVFLSHGHMDHAAGIAYYFAQRMFVDNPPGHVYMPEPLLPLVQKLLEVWGQIDGRQAPAHLHPACPGQDIALRRDLLVRPFAVNHPVRSPAGRRIASLGYALIEVRKKLKDEYRELTGPQIVQLKKKGVEIERRVEIPLVAYCGDTAAGDFLELDYVRRAKVLLLECTFVEDDHLDRARAGDHIHVRDLARIVPKLENEHILLIHLSRRTPLYAARERIRAELGPQDAERVSLLMEHRRRRRRKAPEAESATPDKARSARDG